MDTFKKNLKDILNSTGVDKSEAHELAAERAYMQTLLRYDHSGQLTVSSRHPVCAVTVMDGTASLIPLSSQYKRLQAHPEAKALLPGFSHSVPDGQYKVYAKETVVVKGNCFQKILVPTHYVMFVVEEQESLVCIRDLREFHLCIHDDTMDPKECKACQGDGLYVMKVQ